MGGSREAKQLADHELAQILDIIKDLRVSESILASTPVFEFDAHIYQELDDVRGMLRTLGERPNYGGITD